MLHMRKMTSLIAYICEVAVIFVFKHGLVDVTFIIAKALH